MIHQTFSRVGLNIQNILSFKSKNNISIYANTLVIFICNDSKSKQRVIPSKYISQY